MNFASNYIAWYLARYSKSIVHGAILFCSILCALTAATMAGAIIIVLESLGIKTDPIAAIALLLLLLMGQGHYAGRMALDLATLSFMVALMNQNELSSNRLKLIMGDFVDPVRKVVTDRYAQEEVINLIRQAETSITK